MQVSSINMYSLQYQPTSAHEVTCRLNILINAFVGLQEKWIETHEWEMKLNN